MKNFLPVKARDTVWQSDWDKIMTLTELEKLYKSYIDSKASDIENSILNESIHKENSREFNEIIELAKSYGYKVNEYIPNRGKNKSYYRDEKWVEALRKQLPNTFSTGIYNPAQVEDNYKKIDEQYLRRKKQLELQETQSQRFREEKKIIDDKEKMAIRLAVKYGLPIEYNDRASICEALISLDKYIILAYAMMETRGDWSGGFYRVENALSSFKLEFPVDSKIYDDVSSFLCDEDGRVFRDCDFNYNRLFSEFCNQELLEDINKIY